MYPIFESGRMKSVFPLILVFYYFQNMESRKFPFSFLRFIRNNFCEWKPSYLYYFHQKEEIIHYKASKILFGKKTSFLKILFSHTSKINSLSFWHQRSRTRKGWQPIMISSSNDENDAFVPVIFLLNDYGNFPISLFGITSTRF